MPTVIYSRAGQVVRAQIPKRHDGIEVLAFCLGFHFPKGGHDPRWDAMVELQRKEAEAKK